MPPVFIFLSKTLDWLLSPLSWALVLPVAAILARRRPVASRALGAGAVAILVLFSLEPVAYRLDRLVERGARSTWRPGVTYDAVVVLGGSVEPSPSRAHGEPELNASADRLVRGLELFRAGAARSIVLTGGMVQPLPGDRPEADWAAVKLARWGVPPSQLVLAASTRNTREDAIETARIAAAHGWRTLLLVTSAAHLPRAVGCFRAVGLEPDVLPVDFRAGDGRNLEWLPRAKFLAASTDALRELAGRAVYQLAGYTR